ncbi:DNA replication factor Cdt1-like [Physella acuta]|uniref:DNA replication factor Cdt1-like n=1 Tax=Physella acuta TaxID=109671 RepID=UPI0027DDF1FB|nr:DNA replication factor Cdt1-like [Physella acuta]
MAQQKVTEFFSSTKKRNGNVSASKRRKIEIPVTDSTTTESLKNKTMLKDHTKSSDNFIITEEVTSVWDDSNPNGSEFTTPRKRMIVESDISSVSSKSRIKLHIKKVNNKYEQITPSDIVPNVNKPQSAKKKLDLTSASKIKISSTPSAGTSVTTKADDDAADKEVYDLLSSKSHLLSLVTQVSRPEVALSPLPVTPKEDKECSPSPEPVVPKLQNLTAKLKSLSKMNGQALKNRLKQSGKISEIKNKLKGLDTVLENNKDLTQGVKAAPPETSAEKVLPAHERFEHLTEEGIPTLSLPFTYKQLEGGFQAMDQVISMLHNRSEICTFSKLRAAVQNITRKNFEERTVGQIKTIVPDAYIFQQEKILDFDKKTHMYSLTIEPNLKNEKQIDGKSNQLTAEGKLMFSASLLLKRKRLFRNNLLEYLKQLHKDFLASLDVPIILPSEKLARWHPKFQLDKVPEVTVSPLPQPPDVRVYHTAKDVLEHQKGKLINPMVEKAFAKVVAENEELLKKANSQNLNQASAETSKTPMKGIPPALLAKIRAKEAQRLEDELTKKPEEDYKMKIMKRLPEIIRILRTYFVTEKKPALPIEEIYKKLGDSHKSGMSQRDFEQHINLLKELAPDLISVVEIKRGKFLKLDRNIDVQSVTNRILNLTKVKDS